MIEYLGKALFGSVGWELLSQYSLQDLSTRVTWNDIDKRDVLGLLEFGEFALTEGENLLAGQGVVTPYHHRKR